MIKLESFKKLKVKDLLVISLFAIGWLLLSLFFNYINNPFIISFMILTMFVVFIALLIRKVGAITLFYFLAGILTYNTNGNFGIGINKITILVIAGVIFELVLYITDLEIRKVPINLVLAVGISNASIPITIGFLLPNIVIKNLLLNIVNLVLLSFFIGVIGAILIYLIWYNIKSKKFILKYEYE